MFCFFSLQILPPAGSRATAASVEFKVFETAPVYVEKKYLDEYSGRLKNAAIKAGMNDHFRGCGADRLDDRRAKGSLQFKRVLGHETLITMPTHPSLCFPRRVGYTADL